MPGLSPARFPSLAHAHLAKHGAVQSLVATVMLLSIVFSIDRVHAQGTTVVVPANAEWMDTGIDVRAANLSILSIKATGSWTNVAGGQLVGPAGYGSLKLPNAAAPSEPFASLIGKVNGTIFEIGESFGKRSPASGRLFLAMNEVPGTYGDNSGQLTVVITQVINQSITAVKDPYLSLELLSADPVPFYVAPSFRWGLQNKFRPPISGELRVSLDGVVASTEPAPTVHDLATGAELSGTFTLFTGNPPQLSAGDHDVKVELRAYTPDHAVLAENHSYFTAFVPSPPPAISITQFKAVPDYVNQGSQSTLSWTFQPTSTCVPADLLLTKKDYGQPEVSVMQKNAPATTGSTSVVVVGGSSPLHYKLSVACKFCSTCPTLGPTTVTKETEVAFAPLPPPATPHLVINGPFYTPVQVKAKQPFTASWTFENLGGAALDSFDIDLFLDDAKEGSSQTVAKLSAGANSSKSWTVTKDLAPGIHKLELKSNGSSISFGQFEVLP